MFPVLPEGVRADVRVPASSANLGAGFDSLGIALDIYDDLSVRVTPSGVRVEVDGEGADAVPLDDTHLVVRALLRGLEAGGVRAPGLEIVCRNAIPHSRGLGSSAAAVVSGLAAASGLMAKSGVRQGFSPDQMIQLASEFEGHPDNASASVLGSAVVSWIEDTDGAPAYHARRLTVHPAIAVTAFVPRVESSTALTRGLLPDAVPRADAVHNLSRSALAVVALTTDPSCLLPATADRLHQHHRAPVLPDTTTIVAELRSRGVAAFVSGAGPSVLALHERPIPPESVEVAAGVGFTARALRVAGPVSIT
ncbi:homoserine kinase [Williamsia deligens]|uniref:Homoserine kinase n=1 Tax=Williamsia deligens TaxID=321325 RepID=A0ABW3GAC3_9NOCA|nr:homoserine kinase [Williamsia deligens]MCP2196261.1 homoserine kinase [Williamsia deligens]